MTQNTHTRVAALLAAGLLATTAYGTAHADIATSGNGSIGGGNQIGADVDAPINLCGNAIAVLGLAGADCVDGEAEVSEPGPGEKPDGDRDGYDPEEPGTETPEEEAPAEEPEEEREGQIDEEVEEEPTQEPSPEPSGTPSDEASERTEDLVVAASDPAQAPADESRLALTGADQSALTGLAAAAVLAVATGIGLILFGRRRRARA
ncbi:chaplin family protein [Nocardiopsis sp. MG754419]|uniref:chaplin family protein n=1 Tax=Nocardiopsis sp. MG754419 TaxID=2259865 RepID=UPI001BA747A6|nr:chaplin family protein [Nocardiopsis sp. MG754419]MBR8743316.1 hypothetical protein [Nocardiopsis sp. MG754419]